jgi:hypothetical protein
MLSKRPTKPSPNSFKAPGPENLQLQRRPKNRHLLPFFHQVGKKHDENRRSIVIKGQFLRNVTS